MKKVLTCVLVASVLVANVSAQKKVAAKPAAKSSAAIAKVSPMKNLNDSFSYAAGVNIANSMKMQGITKMNSTLMQRAIDDVFNNRKTLMTEEQGAMTLQTQLQKFSDKKAAEVKAKSDVFFNENKKRKGVIALPNGLQYEVLKSGDAGGIKPMPVDTVVVHYVGTTTDGKEFDNSIKRGEPATFPLNGVIKGWTEILQLMTKGDKWKVFIPSELGYGERGAGAAIGPNATLIFEIELLDIKPAVTQ